MILQNISNIDQNNRRAARETAMNANIKLRHLRCFVAVADTGSFTLAANRLFQTQSSLTATIKQLEEEAGLKLFDRTTRRVELTKDAIWFKVVAERLLLDFDNAIADLKAASKSQRGHIKIAVAPSMMPHVLAPALKSFRALYPAIRISVYDLGSDKIERAILNGDMDFGLSTPLNRFAGLEYTPVLADPFGVVCQANHPLAKKAGKLVWADLKHHDYVGLTHDTGIGSVLARQKGLLDDVEVNDYASSTTSLLALLQMGGKISVVPALAAHTGELAKFKFFELHKPRLYREITLITRHLRSHSPSTQRILDILLATIKASKNLYGSKVY
jgi:DNA-binding transcriptional LysR family regulator